MVAAAQHARETRLRQVGLTQADRALLVVTGLTQEQPVVAAVAGYF